MEVIQFVMQYNAKIKGKDLTDAEKLDLITEMINVKKYISVREKETLVKKTLKNFVFYENNNIKYNSFERDLSFIILLIKSYTTLNIDEKGYDLLCSNNLLEYVIGGFSKEYEICLGIMNTYVDDLDSKRINLEDLK